MTEYFAYQSWRLSTAGSDPGLRNGANGVRPAETSAQLSAAAHNEEWTDRHSCRLSCDAAGGVQVRHLSGCCCCWCCRCGLQATASHGSPKCASVQTARLHFRKSNRENFLLRTRAITGIGVRITGGPGLQQAPWITRKLVWRHPITVLDTKRQAGGHPGRNFS